MKKLFAYIFICLFSKNVFCLDHGNDFLIENSSQYSRFQEQYKQIQEKISFIVLYIQLINANEKLLDNYQEILDKKILDEGRLDRANISIHTVDKECFKSLLIDMQNNISTSLHNLSIMVKCCFEEIGIMLMDDRVGNDKMIFLQEKCQESLAKKKNPERREFLLDLEKKIFEINRLKNEISSLNLVFAEKKLGIAVQVLKFNMSCREYLNLIK